VVELIRPALTVPVQYDGYGSSEPRSNTTAAGTIGTTPPGTGNRR
jgi:hypothetical protein